MRKNRKHVLDRAAQYSITKSSIASKLDITSQRVKTMFEYIDEIPVFEYEALKAAVQTLIKMSQQRKGRKKVLELTCKSTGKVTQCPSVPDFIRAQRLSLKPLQVHNAMRRYGEVAGFKLRYINVR